MKPTDNSAIKVTAAKFSNGKSTVHSIELDKRNKTITFKTKQGYVTSTKRIANTYTIKGETQRYSSDDTVKCIIKDDTASENIPLWSYLDADLDDQVGNRVTPTGYRLTKQEVETLSTLNTPRKVKRFYKCLRSRQYRSELKLIQWYLDTLTNIQRERIDNDRTLYRVNGSRKHRKFLQLAKRELLSIKV